MYIQHNNTRLYGSLNRHVKSASVARLSFLISKSHIFPSRHPEVLSLLNLKTFQAMQVVCRRRPPPLVSSWTFLPLLAFSTRLQTQRRQQLGGKWHINRRTFVPSKKSVFEDWRCRSHRNSPTPPPPAFNLILLVSLTCQRAPNFRVHLRSRRYDPIYKRLRPNPFCKPSLKSLFRS